MNELQEGQNTGLILVEPPATQWKADKESGIGAGLVNPSGDWRPWLPLDERQSVVGLFESDACVSFSALNVLETQLDFMIAKGLLSEKLHAFLEDNGYLDAGGKPNFSDRFLAKMSGTTRAGNNLFAVWDTIRNVGCVPESMWPYPVEEIKAATNDDQRWAIFYSEIPDEVKAMAAKFKELFEVKYDLAAYPGAAGTPTTFLEMLKTSPLQIATAVCMPWNTDQVIQACGAGTAHATTMIFVEANVCYDIYDHYQPFQKKFALDYTITYAMRGLISERVQPPQSAPFHHTFVEQMDYGQTSVEISYLQQALTADGEFPANIKPTGYFGNITRTAVQKFQAKYGIVSSGSPTSTGYGRVGPKTLAKLNEVFA